MNTETANVLGSALAILGASLSVLGTLANNLWLNHILAMQFWFLSNPILLIWVVGVIAKKWNGGLSHEALAVMYFIFFITGAYGLFLA
jgi:hypothetical protein